MLLENSSGFPMKMSNCTSLILPFLWWMFISISLITVGAQDACYGGNFTTDGAYAKNRQTLLSSLLSNVSESEDFFFTRETGQGPDKVFGYALCGRDVTKQECLSCVNNTYLFLMAACVYQKRGFNWGTFPPCMVQYADRPIDRSSENVSQEKYNVADIPSRWTNFDDIWENLINSTTEEASNNSNRYATNEVMLPWDFRTLYALMLCAPDLQPSTCSECLQTRAARYQACCHGKQGGTSTSPNCVFRWDLFPFYNTSLSSSPPPSAPPPASSRDGRGISVRTIVIITVSIILFMILVVFLLCFIKKRKQKQIQNNLAERYYEIEAEQSLRFDLSTIMFATNDFSDDRKIGKGGFGAVYKGSLPNGQDIAVKRLSTKSGQGETEFINEVVLVAKLQHRNLVRLLGFSFEGIERLLIYEYLPNSSLDKFIFDPAKYVLDWEMRYKIIRGIARGLLYLHEDSRLRIIHRNLKASNILLDEDMNPKISDFGMARLFSMDQMEGDTSHP